MTEYSDLSQCYVIDEYRVGAVNVECFVYTMRRLNGWCCNNLYQS